MLPLFGPPCTYKKPRFFLPQRYYTDALVGLPPARDWRRAIWLAACLCKPLACSNIEVEKENTAAVKSSGLSSRQTDLHLPILPSFLTITRKVAFLSQLVERHPQYFSRTCVVGLGLFAKTQRIKYKLTYYYCAVSHALSAYMRPVVTDVAWSVCVCVCVCFCLLSVVHNCEPCKNG